MKNKVIFLSMVGVVLAFTGCDQTADDKMNAQQEQLAQQGVAQTGMPGISNFTEKKLVRKLYELRDQNISTFSYLPDMNGKLWHLCDSIGYGLPYGTQFSNPLVAKYQSLALPQAEPNGLFMPATAEGTWVMCVDQSKKGEIAPVYVEPRVIVSPFRLKAAGEYQDQ